MQRASVAAGVGGVLFAVLWLLAGFFTDAPGGDYSASSVADFVASDQTTAVCIGLALGLLSALGLMLLLIGLRERLDDDSLSASVFRGAGMLAVAGFAIGWVVVVAVPISK